MEEKAKSGKEQRRQLKKVEKWGQPKPPPVQEKGHKRHRGLDANQANQPHRPEFEALGHISLCRHSRTVLISAGCYFGNRSAKPKNRPELLRVLALASRQPKFRLLCNLYSP